MSNSRRSFPWEDEKVKLAIAKPTAACAEGISYQTGEALSCDLHRRGRTCQLVPRAKSGTQ